MTGRADHVNERVNHVNERVNHVKEKTDHGIKRTDHVIVRARHVAEEVVRVAEKARHVIVVGLEMKGKMIAIAVAKKCVEVAAGHVVDVLLVVQVVIKGHVIEDARVLVDVVQKAKNTNRTKVVENEDQIIRARIATQVQIS